MQYATLLREGLDHCQQLGGELWTDYNEHDPGVTILEQLCYAMTEAGYRADLPVPDLLASARPPGAAPVRDTLLTGDIVLTTLPVTIDDYRKLLYDRVSNLKNAWIEREDSPQYGPLYHVRVETDGEEETANDPAAGSERVMQAVRRVLAAHRNLGEDVASVEVLKPFGLAVRAVIDVARGAIPTDVLGDVLFEIQCNLVPAVSVTSVRDCVDAGMPYDAIFDGPFTALGIVGTSAMGELVRSVAVEDIARLIASVAGVAGVRNVSVSAGGGPPFTSGAIAIPDGCVPRLSPSVLRPLGDGQNYLVTVERDGVARPLERNRVYQHIERRFAELDNEQILSAEQMRKESYRTVSKGTYRQVQRYYSLQHQFPRTYGMGKEGLSLQGMSPAARLRRTMQARQLKAYLLFYDQVLSDRFGQLGNLWQLFCLDDNVTSTYFGQPLVGAQPSEDEPPHLGDWDLLRDCAVPEPEPARHYVVHLTEAPPVPYTLLRSRQRATLAQAQALRAEILHFGAHEHHYRPVPLQGGKLYHIVLHNADTGADGAIAFGTEPVDAGRVQAQVRALAWLVRQIVHDHSLGHAQLRIEARGEAGLQLFDDEGRVLLGASHLTLRRQQWCAARLGESGVNAANFTIRQLHDGHYRLFLYADSVLVAHGEQRFASHEAAARAARQAAGIVAAMCGDPAARERHLRLVPARRSDSGADYARHRRALEAIWHKLDNFTDRRNRFLDHLLARFGECFDDAALASFDPRLHGDKNGFYDDLIGWKLAFLRHCAGLGSGRNQACDYRMHGAPGLGARSGLELRLFCLLGLLGTGSWESAGARARVQAPPFRYWRAPAPSHTHGHGAASTDFFTFASTQPALFQSLLKHGIVRGNYSIAPHGRHRHAHHHGEGHHERVDVLFTWGDGAPQVVHETRSVQLAEREIARMIAYFGRYLEQHKDIYAGEEMVLIEHVLLRPADPPVVPVPAPVPTPAPRENVVIEWMALGWEWQGSDGSVVDVSLLVVLVSDTRHHHIAADAHGQYHAALLDHAGKPLAISRPHASHEDARGALHRLGAHLGQVAASATPGSRKLAEIKSGATLDVTAGVMPAGSGQHDSGAADPFYAFRFSLFFPDWPLRFQNPDFREFATRTAAQNCPAHLAAHCYWISAHAMRRLHRLHGHWMACKQAVEGEPGAASDRAQQHAAVIALNRASAMLRRFIKKIDVSEA